MWEMKKIRMVREWIEAERERLLERAHALECPFLQAFYTQCIESTAADAHEIFLETKLSCNYFQEHLYQLTQEGVCRFYKLAAMHHTIRMLRRRKKALHKQALHWDELKTGLLIVYALEEMEERLLEHLQESSCFYPSGFSELFCKLTARYLFDAQILNGFSFAFIANFWYNSYSSFMGSFTGYVPFTVRLQNAL